jgi:hypothetical protein
LSCNEVTTTIDNKWYFIIKHFQVFCHFNTKLNGFYVIGSTKQRATNVLWTLKAKEQSRKHKKIKSDILSQILSLNPFAYSNYILFISHSFWTIWKATNVLSQNLYNLFKVKNKNRIVEELKLQNHTEHLWKNPKHNPPHFEKAYLVHFH